MNREKAAWAAYFANPNDETLRAALDVTTAIQEAKARYLAENPIDEDDHG